MDNKYISVNYQLYADADGEKQMIEETPEGQPFWFITGMGITLPEFEKALIDLNKDESFDFVIQKADAYGDYMDDRIVELDKNIFMPDGKLDEKLIYVGAIIPLMNEDGNRFNGRILEIGEKVVTVDLNHPYAGFDLNFKGTLLATMVFTQDMLEAGKGNVLNISSMNSFRPLTKIPAYSAAKGAINNFTQWYAVHVAQTGIRCNAIAPGFFLTNQNRFLLTDEQTGELKPRGRKIIANTPTHKFGEPEDLVGTMLYLLSDMSSFVTGIIIPVDGGYSAFGGV